MGCMVLAQRPTRNDAEANIFACAKSMRIDELSRSPDSVPGTTLPQFDK